MGWPPRSTDKFALMLIDPIIHILHRIQAIIRRAKHQVLALGFLPKALQQKDPEPGIRIESFYGRIALPALVFQIHSGFWLAHLPIPDVSDLFSLQSPLTRLVTVKLILLASTLALAADARLHSISDLSTQNLTALPRYIGPFTILSVLFVVVGVMFGFGDFVW